MAGSTAARRARSGTRPTDDALAEEYRRWLREMMVIRRFEEKAGEAYSLGKIGGFCHLYIGQEAVAVGTIASLRPDDYIVCSYREHGHALARGLSARTVMAELFGKAAGCSGGKGGSMHLFDASRGFMGGHGIVGGQNGPVLAWIVMSEFTVELYCSEELHDRIDSSFRGTCPNIDEMAR